MRRMRDGMRANAHALESCDAQHSANRSRPAVLRRSNPWGSWRARARH
jgi:hypothetical protein